MPPAPDPFATRRTDILLLAVGFNLILLQLFVIREFALTLFCTEIMILTVTVAYFGGYSLGYVLSPRISTRWLGPWLFAVVLVHLPLIPIVRYLTGFLAELDRSGSWSHASELAVPLVAGITALALTSFYTVFLPRAIAEQGSSAKSLARCYSIELGGAALGLVVALLLAGHWFGGLVSCYQLALLAIGWALRLPRRQLAGLGACAAAVLLVMPSLDRSSAESFYSRWNGGLSAPKIVHSQHSPYQKIEVIDTDRGRKLFLNGLELFNTHDLEHFNYFLSEVPARLRPGGSALVVGSGSMSSLQHLAPYVDTITTVEIDPAVIEVGKRFFREWNRYDTLGEQWNIVIDDAKHYLSTTEARFDLVVVDVPAPHYVQTGLLFTREFYALVRDRLKPGGLISVYLTEHFPADQPERVERCRASRQIVAALASVFPEICVLDTNRYPYGFAIAGHALGFDRADLENVLNENPNVRAEIHLTHEVLPVVRGVRPVSYDNLDIVWDLNLWFLPYDFH